MDFFYKKIGDIPPERLAQLRRLALAKQYQPTPDFDPDVMLVCSLTGSLAYNAQVKDILTETFPMFDQAGMVATTVTLMKPRSYLLEHTDFVSIERTPSFYKLHIPLTTNDKVGYMWRDWTGVLTMQEGEIYLFNNLRIHSVINLGNEPRYQLIARYSYSALKDPSLLIP
jgi:Aspartyl/Asparaginyl beta-hydroxylase